MIRSVEVASPHRDGSLVELPSPLPLDLLVPGRGPWEVELGFGKGRFLLAQAEAHPGRRFLGIEMAAKYCRIFVQRARRRGLGNWLALRGEALYLLATALPSRFAAAVHVYFPDPWPKSRHHRRRLFDPETVDLVLGLLGPRGRLCFATDHLAYGEVVESVLATHPGVRLRRRGGLWPGGPRTNYEAKYVAEGRPILRLELTLDTRAEDALLHPDGRAGVLVAYQPERR